MPKRSTTPIISFSQAGSSMFGVPVNPSSQTIRAKPKSTSSCSRNSGGKPRLPAYSSLWSAAAAPASPDPAKPSNTSPSPSNWAIYCSIGPPGTNWVSAKLTIMIPSNVGMISSTRLRMYAPISVERAACSQCLGLVLVHPPKIEIPQIVGRQILGELVHIVGRNPVIGDIACWYDEELMPQRPVQRHQRRVGLFLRLHFERCVDDRIHQRAGQASGVEQAEFGLLGAIHLGQPATGGKKCTIAGGIHHVVIALAAPVGILRRIHFLQVHRNSKLLKIPGVGLVHRIHGILDVGRIQHRDLERRTV